MHEKGRYNIRLAEKRGVVVKKVSFSEENIFLWINMLSETTKRNGFHENSREYYTRFIQELERNNA
jgi:lipid II:glycine glycyltransferase (peptidoglycan interpeptide bridge formation enzyme)